VDDLDVKTAVRKHYARIAGRGESCYRPTTASGGCCSDTVSAAEQSRALGYRDAEMAEVPDGANLGLGCGNPVALASLQPGEVVVDLGSGAGIDCFLAANRVGPAGHVIGVDMTPEMLDRARANAARDRYDNVEFRLGEIENLPVADGAADVVISNCVINLSTDKARVFREAFRVLKSGGRLMVSDLVLAGALPETVRRSVEAYAGCISGALLKEDYLAVIAAAGFVDVRVDAEAHYPVASSYPDASETALVNDPTIPPADLRVAAELVVSVKVSARRP
jgi:arsenite methyltransferase